MEKLSSHSKGYPERLQQLLSVRFYLQHMIKQTGDRWHQTSGGRTNYRTLFDEIHRLVKPSAPVCLVTFNYDLLIEQSLALDGIDFPQISDYVTGARFLLFKLHGSVNWAREVDAPRITNLERSPWEIFRQLVEAAASLEMSSRYVKINAGGAPLVASESSAALPAIAIPLLGKSEFECPPQHLTRLQGILPEITKLLLIGWRAREAHFLNLLANGLVTCLGSSDQSKRESGASGLG